MPEPRNRRSELAARQAATAAYLDINIQHGRFSILGLSAHGALQLNACLGEAFVARAAFAGIVRDWGKVRRLRIKKGPRKAGQVPYAGQLVCCRSSKQKVYGAETGIAIVAFASA